MHHLMQKELPRALQIPHVGNLARVASSQLRLALLELSVQGVDREERRA
jgi:hypothetical protein